ncbi:MULTISPECIES: hypothetical protein [Arenibacter]|nr:MULTISPECIES: hypothetical protein [Arenibacter]
MQKEELFDYEFLKQFKTWDELNGFLKELQKTGYQEDDRKGTGRSVGL